MRYPMQSVKDFLTKNYFSYCVYVFLLVGLIPLTLFSKPFLNLLVNEHIAGELLDPFFIAYSQVFEGVCGNHCDGLDFCVEKEIVDVCRCWFAVLRYYVVSQGYSYWQYASSDKIFTIGFVQTSFG